MPDWIRRSYTGVGLTQYRPGRHLKALQEPHLGTVILCIDVSGSMGMIDGGRTRLAHAVAGAERFIADAVAHHYRVGLVLWNHEVHQFVPVAQGESAVRSALQSAPISGGNNIEPTLSLGIRELGPLRGDRVLAIFGDGDIGPSEPAVARSREAAALGIRIIVRGLGEHSAAQLNLIATEGTDEGGTAAVVRDAADLERGIASMALSLAHRGLAPGNGGGS
ncbi:vWA domain-containing protein [Micromonospora sp. NBC_01796]|uniref:vWA domain-containing protein n=1 Tax=Micromonospora sp. NBC_01796 TaxID=2975987 RepID=UPI002DDC8D49|nr:vWA domain-containing protein [Micromonospora sp. NBC_01796]WSA87927.1 VWA domain-containing protein [Micromonospora sp. NBC_01796]